MGDGVEKWGRGRERSYIRSGNSFQTARKLSTDEIVSQCLIFLLAGFDVSRMKGFDGIHGFF